MNKLLIIYEDESLTVVDKPSGIVVNKSQTINEETLQDQLAAYFHLGRSLGIGDRAGIVHRLDRETSGLMVVAKNQEAFDFLQREFKERQVKKEYVALVHGNIKDDRGEVDAAIGRVGSFGKFGVVPGGRESKTEYAVDGRLKISDEEFNGFLYSSSPSRSQDKLESRSNVVESSRLRSNSNLTRSRINYFRNHACDYTLLSVFPKTGRTHQIRVHLKSIGYPLVSDAIYAPSKLLKFDLLWCKRLFLHAKTLEFVHPKTNKRIFFESSLPDDLKHALSRLTPSYG